MKHAQYFDGKVQSLELQSPAGGRATVGVIERGRYTLTTSSEEHIFVIEGQLRALKRDGKWRAFARGDELVVPAEEAFEIEAPTDVAYICYYR